MAIAAPAAGGLSVAAFDRLVRKKYAGGIHLGTGKTLRVAGTRARQFNSRTPNKFTKSVPIKTLNTYFVGGSDLYSVTCLWNRSEFLGEGRQVLSTFKVK